MEDRAAPSHPGEAARGGGRQLAWVAVCIVGSGVLTYAYLAVVARALPTAGYGWFGSFWSLALVIGFGVFSPVELELARVLSAARPGSRAPAGTRRALAGLWAAAVAVLLALSPVLVAGLGGDRGFLLALLVVCTVSTGQFALRGLLLGAGRLGTHGVVLLVDSGLRLLLAHLLTVVAPGASASDFAWTLVAAMALAHLPLLGWTVLRRRGGAAPAPGRPRKLGAAVGHLLVGSLCAQVLLNAAPVLITTLAARGQDDVAAQFVASYTLVRLPLFVAVPLQSALIPVLTAVGADRRRLRALVVRVLVVLGAGGLLALPVGAFLGPPVVSLVFGARYALPGAEIAVLALGSVLHLGLLVTSQALVASARHRQVALVWSAGLAAAAVVFLAVPDLVTRAAAGFAVGSGTALVLAAALLLTGGATAPAEPAPVPDPARGVPRA
ncbi:hypothetical protein [Klenkia brasiliensis]|uniref:hypothetical protein n=1 Tax=Klenkia brasiliensis TaxID=333142 RepID=UPI0013F5DEED|nr:hypothetical protein [Klenkia brasiliensis]